MERLLFLLLLSLSTLPSIFMTFGKDRILISWQNRHTDGISTGPSKRLFCTHSFHWFLKDIVGDLKIEFLTLRGILHKKTRARQLTGSSFFCWAVQPGSAPGVLDSESRFHLKVYDSPLVSSYTGLTMGPLIVVSVWGEGGRVISAPCGHREHLGERLREVAKCHSGRIPYKILARDPG